MAEGARLNTKLAKRAPIAIEKVRTYLGTTYRLYVWGMYFGAAATRPKATAGGKDILERWDFKTMKWKRPGRR
jgi:hypothetical protein